MISPVKYLYNKITFCNRKLGFGNNIDSKIGVIFRNADFR